MKICMLRLLCNTLAYQSQSKEPWYCSCLLFLIKLFNWVLPFAAMHALWAFQKLLLLRKKYMLHFLPNFSRRNLVFVRESRQGNTSKYSRCFIKLQVTSVLLFRAANIWTVFWLDAYFWGKDVINSLFCPIKVCFGRKFIVLDQLPCCTQIMSWMPRFKV